MDQVEQIEEVETEATYTQGLDMTSAKAVSPLASRYDVAWDDFGDDD